ncbi:transcriptional regulator [Phaeobacter gallaeciensis]|uniref:Transcriptional regulator n=1 Tax=Phaeobacter gallaeciensis TaxID=60890 RepID=A0A366X5F4_9RHOB|nr:helix-turn-helix transcriptional regulator [Phaeobacter gallaeciensis]RBW56803.1 transcriptional regulator [Phaeobacter gallaeciensis]
MTDDYKSAQGVVQREVLANIRVAAQLTQSQLSEKLNRPQSYVSKYESGERKLTLVEVREIALCCGLTLPEFVDLFENELKINGN